MKKQLLGLKRSTYLAIAVALALVGLVPALKGKALAYTQLTTRSIQLSSSAASATGTSELVSFTAGTAAKNVRVEFCSNSPLYTDTCTAPGGFSAASATLTVGTNTTGWTIASQAANQVTISSGTLYSTGATTFTLVGVTNPTAVGTFYARIYTYVAQTNDYTSAAAPGTVADFGGIALSTANLISITAKVQETLTFCVSGTPQTASNTTACLVGDISAPTLTIGHGTPATIDSTAVDVASAYTQVSTNASGGISMRMKSANTCSNGGLSSNGGTTCNIPGTPGGSAAAVAMPAGTAGFGLFVAASSNNTTGTGTIAPVAPYNGNGHTTISSDLFYGMNGTNVTSTYGDIIASSSAPLSLTNNQLVFAATAALTTQAGIYTVNESLIVTGTF
jgi:hypothetical protein